MNERRTPAGTLARTGGLALVVLTVGAVLAWPYLHAPLKAWAAGLYLQASALGGVINAPLNVLRLQAGTSWLVPLLLGLMAVTAPCQLSTGSAALAFVVQDSARGQALPRAAAFLLARVLMYSALGLVAVLFFGGRLDAPGEALLLLRRLIGPLMLLSGLVVLGLIRPGLRLGALRGPLDRLAQAHRGVLGAFLLGAAFSLSFCPTLFFLFFGLTVPMALTVPLGFVYPALFGLGMTFPLLVVSTFFTGRSADQAQALTRRAIRLNRVLSPLAGVVFVLAGLFDTFVYWWM